jgi:hypothetical protein
LAKANGKGYYLIDHQIHLFKASYPLPSALADDMEGKFFALAMTKIHSHKDDLANIHYISSSTPKYLSCRMSKSGCIVSGAPKTETKLYPIRFVRSY